MIDEKIARGVGPARLDIAYEDRGDPAHPAVLLLMGLGGQLVAWPADFVEALLAYNLRVIRMDNRDAGRSTHLEDAPKPDLPAVLAGDHGSVAYLLCDMAADAIGLLDVLGVPAAHVVGASMGGYIAQTLAIRHPDRVLSLTSMMSTTGDRSVGQMHPETLRGLFAGPPATTREAAIERALRTAPLMRSPAYPPAPEDIAQSAAVAWSRDHDETAIARQAVASVASGDRTDELRKLRLPALIVHGAADTVCDVSGGRATAAAIPGADLMLLEGMGHDLPRALRPAIAGRIAALVRQAECARLGT